MRCQLILFNLILSRNANFVKQNTEFFKVELKIYIYKYIYILNFIYEIGAMSVTYPLSSKGHLFPQIA